MYIVDKIPPTRINPCFSNIPEKTIINKIMKKKI